MNQKKKFQKKIQKILINTAIAKNTRVARFHRAQMIFGVGEERALNKLQAYLTQINLVHCSQAI